MDRDYDKDILEFGGQGLPIVDDIQIAAAAAASEVKHSESSAPSSSTCSSSDDEIGEGDEEEETKGRPANRALGEMGNAQCLVRLEARQEGKVAVRINVQGAGRSAAWRADRSCNSSDDDDDDEEEEEDNNDEEELESESDIEEIQDYGEIRRIIDAMDGENEEVFTFPPAASELFGSGPAPQLEEFSIAPDEPLSEAGQIMSVIEGTIVVRACSGSRALDEGSILVLENRSVLGIVEDIFGPVQAPLYALRCTSKLSDDVKPQAKVYSVDRLAQFVLPDQLRVKGYDDGEAVSGEESAQQDEVHFSDDEAEAAYRRKLKSKRKGEMEISQQGQDRLQKGNSKKSSRKRKNPRNNYGVAFNPADKHCPRFVSGVRNGDNYNTHHRPMGQGQHLAMPGMMLGRPMHVPSMGITPPTFHPQSGPQSHQFHANATAGQFRAMSLQPHHMVSLYGGMPPFQETSFKPPPPPGPPPED